MSDAKSANPDVVDVLVVGSGPVGLTLAGEAARHGLSCRIVDKLPERSHLSKGLAIHARTLEILDLVGVADEIVELGYRCEGLNLGSDTGAPTMVRMEQLDTRFPFVLILPQWQTEGVLERHLETFGVRTERGVELLGFREEDDAVVADVRGPGGAREQIRARYLVGADGARSIVRHQLGIEFVGRPYPWTARLTDLALESAEPIETLENYTTRRGFLMMVPFADGTIRIINLDHEKQGQTEPPTLADLQESVDAMVPWKGIRLTGPVTWNTQLGEAQHRQASRYRVGRALIAGDAAHIHFPAGGQGMNAGIQDAFNLGWKLSLVCRGAAPAGLLDSYQEERHAVGAKVLRITHLMSKLYTARGAIVLAVRKLLLRRVLPRRPAQARMSRALSGIAVTYRDGGISRQLNRGMGGSLRVGDRAPDCRLDRPDSTGTRLYAELREPFFHLLGFAGGGGAESDAATVGLLDDVAQRYGEFVDCGLIVAGDGVAAAPTRHRTLRDTDGAFQRRYGARPGSLYLLRRDGYVGLILTSPDREALARAMDRWVLPGAQTASSGGAVGAAAPEGRGDTVGR